MTVCSKCKIEKKDSEFYKNKAAKYGISYYCKACSRSYAAQYRELVKAGTVKNNPIDIITKKCCDCKVTKDKSEFHKNKNTKAGINSYCKSCMKIRARKYNLSIASGYGKGRPRKGEIRPTSIGAKLSQLWRLRHPELAKTRSREASVKFKRNNPELVKKHQRSYLQRKAGWGNTKISVRPVVDGFDVVVKTNIYCNVAIDE
jgi:hypothetical protein